MSYESSSYIYPKWVFSGGYVDNTPNTHLDSMFSPYSRNFRLDGASVISRPWHSIFATVGGTDYPRGISSYLRANPTNDRIIVRQNIDATHKLVSIEEDWTQTDVVTGVTKTATTIAFVNSNPDTITDSGNGFLTAWFQSGDTITITGSTLNNWTFTISTVTASTITLVATDSLTAEWAGASITIAGNRITSDNRMNFVNIGEDLFCMNWTDFGQLKGTTYTTLQLTRSYTATTLSFNSTSPPRAIQDSSNSFITKWFSAGQVIVISGSASNNGTFTIESVTANQITLSPSATLVDEWAWASVTITGQPAAPSFGAFFAWCQWVGWYTTTGYGNQVSKSPNNAPSNFTGAGSDLFTFPENVTGIKSGGQSIFVFSTNTLHACTLGDQVETAWVISFSFKPIQTTEGATNNASIVSVGSNVYYLSSSNKINMIARGSNVYWFEVVELSDRKYKGISRLMQSLDKDQSSSFATYYPEQSIIKWFMKSNGSDLNDVCIIYDVEKDMFLQDTNKYFYDGTSFKGFNYTVSQITPTVFKDEFWTDDDGSGISFEYWTKWFDEGEYTLKKGYWESRTDVALSDLAVLTQEIYMNSSVDIYWNVYGALIDTKTVSSNNFTIEPSGIGTGLIGDFTIGEEWPEAISMYPVTILRTKWNLNTRGYSIQYRYTNSVIGGRVQLLRLGYKMEILPSITTELTI